jgi:hypothetical protein
MMLRQKSRIRKLFTSAVAALVLLTVNVDAGSEARESRIHNDQAIRVLFIGNSYTYFNNVPELLTKLAQYGNQGPIETRMVAPGGFRLEDHWEKGEALKALHDGKWDYVVLQDQSTLGMDFYLEGKLHVTSDEVFRPFAEKWSAEIIKQGATPIYYLTWARKATPEDQAALNYAYVSAARKTGSRIAPVGIAWGMARRDYPSIDLYYKDGSHPSTAGSYLAACTFYATIFHQNPVGLPSKITGTPVNLETEKAEPEKTAVLVDLPADQARALQTCAWRATEELAQHGGYLDVSPVAAPALPTLPTGIPFASPQPEGAWRGKLVLIPGAPADMLLKIGREGTSWKGHLELQFHSKNNTDESFDLEDLMVTATEIKFTDPKSVSDLKIHFRGLSPRTGELIGNADASLDRPVAPVRLLGTFQLHKTE